MVNFTFEKKQQTFLFGAMGVGLACLAIVFFTDDDLRTHFWSQFLVNSVFFTGLAFMSIFILAAFTAAQAGWYTVMKRVWEAYSLNLIPSIILMLILAAGLWGHFHHLYHWADPHALEPDAHGAIDKVLLGKSGFLNKWWYTLGTIIILGIWIFFARKFRALSLEEEKVGSTADFAIHRKTRFWSAIFLPLSGYTSAALIWQWIMSVDAHWYSTLYAWYATASWFVATMALTILTLIYLKSKGYFANVNAEHFHDLGKYLFAISIFWTYLWFSQYMLIWYGNVGEETVYFLHRKEHYPIMFFANLIINFVVPFFVLMRNDTKRKFGTLAFASIVLLFGHWLDFFLMIIPGVRQTARHAMGVHDAMGFELGFSIPGILDIGIFVGFLAAFVYFGFKNLAKAPLDPTQDPYYEESLHHHV